jgi:heme-degrading monooxygenase HmoA
VIGVSVTFQYDNDFDRARVVSIAENARRAFEGMPGLRSKVFAIDDARHRAMNFYVWESPDAAKAFFSEEMRERVTGLYGVRPTIDFVEITQLVDNLAPASLGT